MNTQCPYCKSEKTEKITIKFSNGQEQGVILCKECRKIFGKEKDE